MRRPAWVSHAVPITAYAAFTTAMTWPLVTGLTGVVPHDVGDPLLSTWALWWNARVLPFSDAWWDGPLFFPVKRTLTLSDHRVGLGVITTPLIWAGGSPVAAHNVAFLLSFLLSAIAAYALCYGLTRSRAAAFLGGLAFGFHPFRAEHLSHLELLSSYWLPVIFVALHAWIRTQAHRWLLLLATALTMQGLTSGYYFFFALVLLGLWIVWFARGLPLERYLALSIALVTPLIAIAPILLEYRRAHVEMRLARSITDIELFSADVTGLLSAPLPLAFWNTPAAWQRPEGALMPGLITVILVGVAVLGSIGRTGQPRRASWRRLRVLLLIGAATVSAVATIPWLVGPAAFDVGAVRVSVSSAYKPLSVATLFIATWFFTSAPFLEAWRRRSAFAFYVLATGLMWLFAFGPTVRFLGHRVLYKAPYSWLMMLPGFRDEFRVPARFAMLAALTLSVAAALAFCRLLKGRSYRVRMAAACALAIGIAVDGWVYPFVVVATPPPLALPATLHANAAVLELPIGIFEDATAMYHAMVHGRPTINGMSGYEPPHYSILRVALEEGTVDALSSLASRGDIAVFVSRGTGDGSARFAATASAKPLSPTGTHDIYLFAHRPRIARAPDMQREVAVRRLTSAMNPTELRLMTDGDTLTLWSSAAAQRGMEEVTADLERVFEIEAVVLALGQATTAYPRVLAIDISEDFNTWKEVWRGATAGESLAAAVDDPRNVAVPFSFPPERARYIRLRQLGQSSAPWGIAELHVLARQ